MVGPARNKAFGERKALDGPVVVLAVGEVAGDDEGADHQQGGAGHQQQHRVHDRLPWNLGGRQHVFNCITGQF